jgi:hypothetical protein
MAGIGGSLSIKQQYPAVVRFNPASSIMIVAL